MSNTLQFERNTKALLDDLKSVCATAHLKPLIKKPTQLSGFFASFAEREGFEPPDL